MLTKVVEETPEGKVTGPDGVIDNLVEADSEENMEKL